MASDSRKYFDAAQDRKNDLSKEFGAAHASDDKPYDLSAVVEAANNFLGGYAPQTAADVQRLLYDAATNPGSLGASVMVTSHMPNVTPEEQKKKRTRRTTPSCSPCRNRSGRQTSASAR